MYIIRMIKTHIYENDKNPFHPALATVLGVIYASVNKTHIVSAYMELLNFERDKYKHRKMNIYYKL